jgi:antitoxin (DNA-binding transcriptional repressor) of toxin-antitoxin stability system
MRQINIHDAKTHLSRLVDQAVQASVEGMQLITSDPILARYLGPVCQL